MKTDFMEWSDVPYRSALSTLMRLRALMDEQWHTIAKILVHPILVAKGFVFIIEFLGEYYVLINAYDFEEAKASLPFVESDMDIERIIGIPVINEDEEIKRILTGVFVAAVQVR